YFIHADIDMYHEQTDTACLPRTWNISDDLGQIEYVFSDKTGTLTQNVMEYRKCTIGGIEYGLGETEATYGSYKRDSGHQENDINGSIVEKTTTVEEMEEYKKNQGQRSSIFHIHFFSTLALCHTAIAERSDKNQDSSSTIEYKAQSPDEAALVSTARDIGFTFLGREADLLSVNIMGEIKTFDLLNVLEFNSTRKRMSVIIRPRDGSNRIVLLSKGADSVIYERLCTNFGTQHDLESKQQNIRDDTSTHLEGFATEGLRTLCLAYRFIAANEYEEWNKRFMSASSSIYGRDEKVDEVCEEIESDLLLMGGTAIEDRLQEGVPETIALLAQSGIKLWVLTGDKTETAINIGYACNLITTDMELLIVKSSTREGTLERMKEVLDQIDREIGDDTNNDNDVGGTGSSGDCKLLVKIERLVVDPLNQGNINITNNNNTTKEEEEENDQQRPHHQRVQQGQSVKRALVIDGTTLKYALEPKNKYYLLRLGMQCASVICCRVSPKQKAQVVTLVKRGLDVMTLAIEGRQAVMSSDYAIAQFRYLQKLLLVHGRWSYLRTAEMIMGFFFKNIIWTFVLLWYQIFCQFTGTMMFDYALVTLYNLIFTSLPIIFLGIWDQDLNASTSLLYPELYTVRFWMNVIDSIFQSSVCFFFPYMLLVAGAVDPSGYDQNGTYEIGTIIASYAVIVANLFVAFSLYSYTWIQLLIISLSIAVYYLFTAVYSQFISFNFRGQVKLYGTGLYWLVLLLTVVTCFIPQRELILHNRRHLEQQEEKSSKETIQPSLPTDKDKSTTTTLGPDPF
ncbi:uncharacterized protein BX664DRAFT_344524, partial [Halteromyces radiatus]|uniref:uncharacterized protein n=1 Tax=Halteromyces radiatus TaxID=101107 RepID=UPI00221FDBBD